MVISLHYAVYYNPLTLDLLQAFAVDKYFPASLCSGVQDEEPNDPQCSQMQKYSF